MMTCALLCKQGAWLHAGHKLRLLPEQRARHQHAQPSRLLPAREGHLALLCLDELSHNPFSPIASAATKAQPAREKPAPQVAPAPHTLPQPSPLAGLALLPGDAGLCCCFWADLGWGDLSRPSSSATRLRAAFSSASATSSLVR